MRFGGDHVTCVVEKIVQMLFDDGNRYGNFQRLVIMYGNITKTHHAF